MNPAGSVLPDTNIVVAHFRNDPDVTSRLSAVAALYLPWVVLGELYFGAQRARLRQEQFALIREFLRTTVLLLPDQDTTVQYGGLKAELAEGGTPIPDNDIWIAALARQYDLPLATRDAHFALVPRLTVLRW